jgi:hypothetical protein
VLMQHDVFMNATAYRSGCLKLHLGGFERVCVCVAGEEEEEKENSVNSLSHTYTHKHTHTHTHSRRLPRPPLPLPGARPSVVACLVRARGAFP